MTAQHIEGYQQTAGGAEASAARRVEVAARSHTSQVELKREYKSPSRRTFTA